MQSKVLYVVRHGRTSYNVKGLFRGEANPPLTEEGLDDAREVDEFLEGVEPCFIISSDKKRAVQTAHILAKDDDIPLKDSELLRAWNLGMFSGQPKNKENLDKLEEYIQNPSVQVPDGESLEDFRDRILPVLAECFEMAAQAGKPGIVVAHSSVIHELGSQIFGNHSSLVVKPGGIVVVGFDGKGNVDAERIFKPLMNRESAASVS